MSEASPVMPQFSMPRDMSRFSTLEAQLLAAVNAAGLPEPVAEHRFAPPRRWRFDFAWPDLMLAVECEGGTYSGGRHTTGTGFEKDAEKYLRAAELGWTVLRVTQRQITSGAALESLERVIERLSRDLSA